MLSIEKVAISSHPEGNIPVCCSLKHLAVPYLSNFFCVGGRVSFCLKIIFQQILTNKKKVS